MIRAQRLRLAALVAVSGLGLAVAGLGLGPGRGDHLVRFGVVAGADETTEVTSAPPTDPPPTDPPTTDPTSTEASSTTTTPGPVPESTTTTPVGSLPPPGSETDVGSAFGPQAAFDPKSRLALPAEIARATREKTNADRGLVAARVALSRAQQAIADYQHDLGGLAASEKRLLAAAQKAQSLLVERAVTMYMAGGGSSAVDLLARANPSEIEIGMAMLDEVLDQLGARARDYATSRDALSSSLRGELDAGVPLPAQLAAAQSGLDDATAVDQAAGWQLEAYEDNSHVWIPGFIFPVLGPTRFDDSFGDGRLAGTTEQHWHEGCDVVAAAGTPMVAVDDGVLTSFGGADPLGGNSVILTAASGYWYYYAHLSAFAPGLKQGDAVKAGQVIGLVGATGDAMAPHLHFEIHDPTGQVLDAYGLLKAAWVARQSLLWMGGDDPSQPPDMARHPDPGTPAGFPRYPNGSPVPAVAGQVLTASTR